MLLVASLFQCYQNEFLMKKTLRIFRKFSEHFSKNQFIYQFYFILFYFIIIIMIISSSSKDVSVTYFQNMPIWNKWLLNEKLKEHLHTILVSRGEIGYARGKWFRAGKLVPRGETGSARGNWFHSGKLVPRGETGFLLPLVKLLSIYLWWNKLLIMQNLVAIQFCDFLRN